MELARSFALEFEVLQESTEPLSPFNGLNLYMPVRRESPGMRLYASVNCRLCSSVIKSVTRCSGGRGEAVVTTYYACVVNWNDTNASLSVLHRGRRSKLDSLIPRSYLKWEKTENRTEC